MNRYLAAALLAEMPNKILLLTGPRQCGKTTLAKSLLPRHEYLNHNLTEHRLILREKSWGRSKPLVIFDELHKMQDWKRWLKGIYDVEGIPPGLLPTSGAACVQVVGELKRTKSFPGGERIVAAKDFLAELKLGDTAQE